jgi:hypothetical protein
MQENTLEIVYSVKINYSFEAGTPFCIESAKNNLSSAIENERLNCALTPDDISADNVDVDLLNQESSTMSILDVNMTDIIGDYDTPDGIKEWQWIQKNACFSHRNNGKEGLWDFMVNISVEHTNTPFNLLPVIISAIASGHSYILFNQGT